MENLVAALKLLGPIMLTPLINRVISSFRFRQLYLSFEDVLPCTLPDNIGYTANIRIYNKGKDKENEIEVIFPKTSLCQVLSSDYPTVSSNGARILIDRILPKQTISLTVYLKTESKISKANKPFIKSEDVNGKTYDDKHKVPPSAGPAAMGVSIFIAITLSFLYVALSDTNVFSPYYNYKYKPLLDQGFKPLIFSRTHMVENMEHSSTSPLLIGKPYIEKSQIIMPISVKNIGKDKLSFLIQPNYQAARIKETAKADRDNSEFSARVKAWRAIAEKYGSTETDKIFIDRFALAPAEERTELIKKTVTSNTTLENFNLTISVEDPEDSTKLEFYLFDIQKSKEKDEILKLMKTLSPK